MSTSSPAGSPPTPDWIPSVGEILRYFAGVSRLMGGKPDGLRFLDLSADGFWRSFAAMLVAAPPTILSWIEFETLERQGPRADTPETAVYAAHALADLTAWLLPLLILVTSARPVGFSRKVVPLVVALNWGGALLTWGFAPVLLVLALVGPGGFADAFGALFAVAALILTGRLAMAATGSDAVVGAGIVALLVVSSLVAYAAASDVTGVPLF